MITNEKIKLLEVWKNEIFNEFTISEIMKLSKKKTKTWVFNSLKLLTKNKLLISKRKGNLDIYSLNINNPLLIQMLQYLDIQNTLNFPFLDMIIEILGEIPIKNYCFLIFGSYVKNKQKSGSDLDICFLIENNKSKEKIKPYVNEIKLNYHIKIDEHYITFDDFVKMLLVKDENLGKQIFRKHMLFYNSDIYYKLIKEAYKHGFRP